MSPRPPPKNESPPAAAPSPEERYLNSYGSPPAADVSTASAHAQEQYYSSYGTPDKAESMFPAADFRGGDSPVDHPGASRAAPTPTTIEIVRPERTIVRDVDELLPLILSSAALLLVLAGLAVPLVRGRMLPGRSH